MLRTRRVWLEGLLPPAVPLKVKEVCSTSMAGGDGEVLVSVNIPLTLTRLATR